jgi:hypothetical protein
VPRATWPRRSIGTIVGMVIFAALMVSALGLMVYGMYEMQRINAVLSSHNRRTAEALQYAGSICSSWHYDGSLNATMLRITNRSPRPARLVGVLLLYGPASFDAYNESLVIAPGTWIELRLPSSREPVSIVLSLVIEDVAVKSTCKEA